MVDTNQEKEAQSILRAKSWNHSVEEKEEEKEKKKENGRCRSCCKYFSEVLGRQDCNEEVDHIRPSLRMVEMPLNTAVMHRTFRNMATDRIARSRPP